MFEMQSALRTITLLTALLLLAGCVAHVPPPVQQLSAAQTAIAAADDVHAEQAAPDLVASAKHKLLKAKAAIGAERYRQATWLLEDAIAEADMARAKARNSKTRQTVDKLQHDIKSLRQQLGSSTS